MQLEFMNGYYLKVKVFRSQKPNCARVVGPCVPAERARPRHRLTSLVFRNAGTVHRIQFLTSGAPDLQFLWSNTRSPWTRNWFTRPRTHYLRNDCLFELLRFFLRAHRTIVFENSCQFVGLSTMTKSEYPTQTEK